ncbi:hypothetical protein Y032_0008g383 [Ancylostoma ceylanicum]|uniref:Uncharacterized protein n=1 Tax=Ancylostoma ceylanicum TaxID=53326 RepID=A0A016VME4_9BILA|nr:hypothetical protein Y032_0008g383 [Ancylostoma ceylanicum]
MAEANPAIRSPRDLNESNIAMDAIMKELMQRLNFGSKTLIHGQEDILTLSEYEALFEVDMEICERALDVLIALTKQQKTHLEALVAAKKMERSLPSSINEALTEASAQIIRADDLRKRVIKGDFSFFADNIVRKQLSSQPCSSDGQSSSHPSDVPDAPVVVEDCDSEQPRTTVTSLQAVSSTSTATLAFRKRERPQFSSDAARRVLGEMNLIEEMHTSIRKPSGSNQIHLEKPPNSSTHYISADRNLGEGKLNGKHISASGGCSLDGSIMDSGENGSVQNGLRAYSPVYDIPPQPNFDESDVYSFSEKVLLGTSDASTTGSVAFRSFPFCFSTMHPQSISDSTYN